MYVSFIAKSGLGTDGTVTMSAFSISVLIFSLTKIRQHGPSWVWRDCFEQWVYLSKRIRALEEIIKKFNDIDLNCTIQ